MQLDFQITIYKLTRVRYSVIRIITGGTAMKTTALIVAAGMSSRMGNFKPMLSIGSISVAQRVVATFQQVGIHGYRL